MKSRPTTTRRDFLAQSAAATAGLSLASFAAGRLLAADDKPIKVAALITSFSPRSHAHVILENFVQPYLFNGQVTQPGMQVASFYVDQIAKPDMSRDVAKQFNIPIFPTIAQALTLGGDQLAVDAVLLIAEHGDYPVNAKAQMQYPRKQFFDQTIAVFKSSGRVVPLFCDKHLSYRWDWAKEMYDTTQAMKIPFMAGSSVPLAQRRPPFELPAGAKITQAVSIHAGGVESYDIHALEVLQSVVEARAGGEKGVRRVQFLDGDALWSAAEQGQWSPELAATAMAAEVGADHALTKWLQSRGKSTPAPEVPTHGIAVEYLDGLKAIALKVGSSSTRWNFACQLTGETTPRATAYYVGPW